VKPNHRGGILALAVTLLAALPVGASGVERPLSLDEAVRLAAEKNEGIWIERHGVAAATAAIRAARGAYDPVLGLDWGWRKSSEPANTAFSDPLAPESESAEAGVALRQLLPSGGELALRGRGGRETTDATFALLSPAYDTRMGVELKQPLLRGLGIDEARLSRRVARAGYQGASASLRRTLNETVAAVEEAYWALAAARLGVGVREEAVRLAEAQLGETRTRVQSGTVPGTELAQPRAELERRRGELLAARETVARTENTLKLLIFTDTEEDAWRAEIAPTDSVGVAVTPVDVEASLRRALSARPEVDAAKSTVERRRAESAFARNAVWPSLQAVLSYDRFGLAGSRNPLGPSAPLPPGLEGDLGHSFDRLSDGDFDAARLALVLELPLPNRSARGASAAARSAELQAEAAVARVRKAIRAEVLDAAAALETAGQRIEAARAGREAAQVQLDAEADRYRTGLSTNFLLLTRQNDLSRARLDEISALTDYRVARSEMARATGSLTDEQGIQPRGIEP
jgi:outer membrane protein TolC